GRQDPGAQALSRSGVGFAGLARLLESGGARVMISRGDDPDARAQAGLLILTPPPGAIDDETWSEQSAGRRPTLVVLPKWRVAGDPRRAGYALNAGLLPDAAVANLGSWMGEIIIERREHPTRPVLEPGQRGPDFEPLRLGATASFQTFYSRTLIPWIVDEQGRTVLANVPDTEIYVLSDPDLLNNHGLAEFAPARAAMEHIDTLGYREGPILFDVSLNGFARARKALRHALEPPFLAATLCLLAAALLAGWQAIIRFGAPLRKQRAFAYGKEALADNSAGLIRLAGAEHRLGVDYARVMRDEAARALAAPRALKDAELAAYLDRLGRQAKLDTSLTTLTDLARIAPDRNRLLSAARALYQWKAGVVRAAK
ncbi:MAG: hypothetical protein AB7J28_17175, partial [Hyphomonadaceae bacterium]